MNKFVETLANMQKVEEKLNDVIFYQLERAVKVYRQFAQKNITVQGFDITIDQWLVMKVIVEDDHVLLHQIAEKVFKDNASVSRILGLLHEKAYITSTPRDDDKRRQQLRVTPKGSQVLKSVQKIIDTNRKTALKGISPEQIVVLSSLLNKINMNCRVK